MSDRAWIALHWVLLATLCGTAHAQWKPDKGLVLVGKVVTMNDAGDVLPNARVWLANGKIWPLPRRKSHCPTRRRMRC